MTYSEYRTRLLTMAQECGEKSAQHKREFDSLGIKYAASAIVLAAAIPTITMWYAGVAAWFCWQALKCQKDGTEAQQRMLTIRQDILNDLAEMEAWLEENQEEEN